MKISNFVQKKLLRNQGGEESRRNLLRNRGEEESRRDLFSSFPCPKGQTLTQNSLNLSKIYKSGPKMVKILWPLDSSPPWFLNGQKQMGGQKIWFK